MKVIVTGRGGQLASEFEQLKGNDPRWTFFSAKDLDITDNLAVEDCFAHINPNVIINCAAYTAVDRAEDNVALAYGVNEKGVENLVDICNKSGSKLIHYSTDYVFNGESKSFKPYSENDPTEPRSVYGKSKLAGEELLKEGKDIQSIIIRTSWVYSNFGQNFVKTMLRLGKEKSELGVVSDQIGTPTFARDLAEDTLIILEDSNYQWKNGDIFHYSNEGSCSWYDFAKQIFELTDIEVKLNALLSEEFPTRAVRPKFSLLDKSKFKKTFKVEINHWKVSLENMLKQEL